MPPYFGVCGHHFWTASPTFGLMPTDITLFSGDAAHFQGLSLHF